MQLNTFFEEYFQNGTPCSFHYGGIPVSEQFGALIRDPSADGKNFTAYRKDLTISTGKSGAGTIADAQVFKAVLKIRKYQSAIEWWLEMSAGGTYDTRIIDTLEYASLIVSATRTFHTSGWKYPLFHWSHGSLAQTDDFQPVTQNFIPESRHVLSCGGGRTSSGCLPYFNLQMQENMGVIFAIGWNGQWKATFQRLDGEPRSVRFTAEMDDAHFRIHSGETLVLPKVVAFPWEGTEMESYNLFRRFMRYDILPKYDGKPLEGYICLRSWGGLTPEIHRAKFNNVKQHKLGAELYQIDAGWHGDETTPKSDHHYFDLWPQTVGIWEPLPALYPDGFSLMNRDCRDAGMGFAVWFEPERMPSWNEMVKTHREYFIGPKLPDDIGSGELWDKRYYLMLNLGYEPARKWITDTLSKVIDDASMEVLRIDFNYEPLDYWKYNDESDRRGVSEIKYVNGVYEMLDELLARHPNLKIDNCASGGRRLDYRMFRRSMPMICRSDYFCAQDNEPMPKQAHTYGLSKWIPAHADSLGSCIGHTSEVLDTYRARSTMCSGIGMTAPWWDLTEEEAAWYRKTLSEAKAVREYMSEDFYPLTGYTLSELDWMAYQFHRQADSSGLIMTFRHEENHSPEMMFGLYAMDDSANYQVTDADYGDLGVISGAEMKNLSVRIEKPRDCRIIFYKKR